MGPCRLNFGLTVAAGTIVRKDEIRRNRFIFGREGKGGSIPFEPGRYHSNKRIIMNNIIYIGNLIALQQWYRQVRTLFISTRFPEPLLSGLKKNIQLAIEERIERLKTVCLKTPLETGRQKPGISECWPRLNETLKAHQEKKGDTELRDKFLEYVSRSISMTNKDYIAVIQELAAKDSENGVRWLQGIVDGVTSEVQRIMPAIA